MYPNSLFECVLGHKVLIVISMVNFNGHRTVKQKIQVKNVRAVGTVGAIAPPIFLEINKEVAFSTPSTSRLED